MNCHEIQGELMLLVGQDDLPDEIQRHLDRCAECSRLWTELNQQAQALGRDEDLYVDEITVARLAAQVDERIDAPEMTNVTSISSAWKTYVPAAAAVVLLVGISLTVHLLGWLGGNGQKSGLSASDSLWVVVDDSAVVPLDDEELPNILGALLIDGDQAVQAILQDDLTEEEFEYLDKNFDVGEIL